MRTADSDERATGEDVKDIFARSGLPQPCLARAWALADDGRKGFLDFTAFCKAMELLSLSQAAGAPVTDAEWQEARNVRRRARCRIAEPLACRLCPSRAQQGGPRPVTLLATEAGCGGCGSSVINGCWQSVTLSSSCPPPQLVL